MNEKYLDREKNCGKSLAEHRKFSNISKKKNQLTQFRQKHRKFMTRNSQTQFFRIKHDKERLSQEKLS